MLVRQTDVAGNTNTSAAFNFTIDTGAPASPVLSLSNDTGSSNSDGISKVGTVSVAGLETGSTRQYSVDGGLNWVNFTASSFTLTGDGDKTVIVRQTDGAGNSTISDPFAFTLDKTVAKPLVSLADDTGRSQTDHITQDGTVNVGGLEAGATAEYSLDAGQTWNSITGTSFTVTGDGLTNVRVRETDVAGNTSAVTTFSFTLDTTAPAPLVFSLLLDTGTSDSDLISYHTRVVASGLETGAVREYSTDGGDTWTTFSSAFPIVQEGENSILGRQTDAAGNVSYSDVFTFVRDTIPPDAGTLSLVDFADTGSAGDGLTSDNDFSLSVAGQEDGSAFVYEVSTDGGSTWTPTDAIQSDLADGSYRFHAAVSDVAGNIEWGNEIVLEVDTTAPGTPAISSIVENADGVINASEASNGTPVVVSLTGTNAVAGDTLTVNWGGQTVNHVLTAGEISAVSATVTVPAATLTAQGNGTFDVTASLTDRAGNAGSNSSAVSVTVDTIAPNAPAISSIAENAGGGINQSEASDGTPVVVSLTGTNALAGDTLTVNWGGQTVNHVLTASDITADSVSMTVASATITAQGNGTFNVTAKVTDQAGNPGSNSSAVSVKVDTIAPNAPAISIAENAGGGINQSEASDGTPVVVSLTGTNAVAGDTLTVNWGGQAVNYVLTASDITAVSATVTVPAAAITAQGNGTFNVTANITDQVGNAGSNSSAVSVTVDTVAPNAPSAPDMTTATDLGVSNSDNITTDSTPDFAGTAEAGSTVRIFSDGIQVGSGVATGGNYSITTSALAIGNHSITANATDAVGNVSVLSGALPITIESVSPATLTTGTDKVLFTSGTNTVNSGATTATNGDSLTGGSGTDTLAFSFATGALNVSFGNGTGNVGMTGFESITITDSINGTHVDTLTFDSTFNDGQTLSVNASGITGNNGTFVLAAGTSSNAFNVTGSGKVDTITTGSGNDTISAGAGADELHGGLGNDTLTGGANNDRFYFETALNASTNVDTITDFDASNNVDKIYLDDAIFTAAGSAGTLSSTAFTLIGSSSGNATTAGQRILYDTSTGDIYYDADGSGSGFAKVLIGHLTLAGISGVVDASDFIVF